MQELEGKAGVLAGLGLPSAGGELKQVLILTARQLSESEENFDEAQYLFGIEVSPHRLTIVVRRKHC